MSFNIPAYRFDLSPFLGLLNDKRVRVLSNYRSCLPSESQAVTVWSYAHPREAE
jgi:hypothetical protein